jgi:hypothetical protein
MDPEVRLAVIDVTREELERTLTPIVGQLKDTLTSIEGKLVKMDDCDRQTDRDNVKIASEVKGAIGRLRVVEKSVGELRDKVGTLKDNQTGISTRVAVIGGAAMIVLNIVITLVVFMIRAAIESGLGAP